ncbi:MAG: alpha/beta hydrolase [bacterium]|nr:alpha/beta hydrolase [bacterium]
MQHKVFKFKARDNTELYGQIWFSKEPLQGVVCLIHGLGEHSGRYRYLQSKLNKAGYALAAFDLRGHGFTDGISGHLISYEVCLDDIEIFLREVRKELYAGIYILYGHGLGGNLVLNYLLRRDENFAGAVVSSPWLMLYYEPPEWKLVLAKIVDIFYPSLTIASGIKVEDRSQDQAYMLESIKDNLLHDKISVSTLVDFYESGQWAIKNAHRLRYKTLLMHGTGDKITLSRASVEFASKCKELCTLKLWHGMYHELHNEVSKDQVIDFVIEWLKEL